MVQRTLECCLWQHKRVVGIMRELTENLTLFFIGTISGTFGVFLSEVHPVFPAKSEVLLSLLIWFAFLTVIIIYKAKKHSVLALPIFFIIFLANYYYIHPVVSLLFSPIIPLLPLILIAGAYFMKICGDKSTEFVLRAIALSFLGICVVFMFWINLFLYFLVYIKFPTTKSYVGSLCLLRVKQWRSRS